MASAKLPPLRRISVLSSADGSVLSEDYDGLMEPWDAPLEEEEEGQEPQEEPAAPPPKPGRRNVSPSDLRSISSSANTKNPPSFAPYTKFPKHSGLKPAGMGWGKPGHAQLAPLTQPMAAVVKQLKDRAPSHARTHQPWRMPPATGALTQQNKSPKTSPERQRIEELAQLPGAGACFAWDLEFKRHLREKIRDTGGFMDAMTESPTSPDAVYEPLERKSVIWFRDNYPEPPPAHRRDVLALQQWLEDQMLRLQRTLQQQQQQLQGSKAASPRELPSPSSPAMGAPGDGSQEWKLTDNGRSSVQVARDEEGFISTPVLAHQEQLLTKAMEELCGQTATVCVERGHFMWQLWAALRHMLRLVLQDREAARNITREARRSELTVVDSVHAEQAVTKSAMDEVAHMNEVLNRRVLSKQAEIDMLRTKVAELEAHIASQANCNPLQMQQDIDDLQVALALNERQMLNMTQSKEALQHDLNEVQKEVQYLTSKLSEARNDLSIMAGNLAVRTPRPSQPRMPPWELIKEEEALMAQQALREGCSPKDMHRLMLGVSFTNCFVLPWINNFMGCCRMWTPAAKGTEDAAGAPTDGAADAGDEGGVNAAGVKLAGALAQPRVGLSVAGSTAKGASVGTMIKGGRKSKFFHPTALPIKELHPQLSRLIASGNLVRMQRSLAPEVVQAISEMANHGIDVDTMACLLLGCLSPDGLELTSYKSLAGILSSRFSGSPEDIGGPVTEALVMAAMSTKDRVEALEQQLLQTHRTAVKLRRAVVEQRKQQDDQKEHEMKLQSRKVVRAPHPLSTLLEQKRVEFFQGLGTDAAVPLALQYEGRVYNRAMEKADAERMVNAIWQSKREFQAAHNISVTLADYVYVYMQRKHGAPKAVAEATYNLLYNLSKHMYDPDCSIFLKVFMNDLGEDVKDAQDELRGIFLDALKKVDEETNGKVTGWLLKSDMRIGLRTAFKHKTEYQMAELYDALDSDEPRQLVNYFRLFDSDNDLNQGVFAETVRQQHLNEQLLFYQGIEDVILDQVEKNNSDSCTPAILSYAFRKAHPSMLAEEMDGFQKRVFGSGGQEKEKGKKSVPLNEALRLLRTPRMPHLVDAAAALELARQSGPPTTNTAGAKPGAKAGGKGKGIAWGSGNASGENSPPRAESREKTAGSSARPPP